MNIAGPLKLSSGYMIFTIIILEIRMLLKD